MIFYYQNSGAKAATLPSKTFSVGTRQTTNSTIIGSFETTSYTFTAQTGDSPTQWSLAFNPPGSFAGGDYFTFDAGSGNLYYCWYTIDGVGTDPGLGGYTAIEVDCSSTDDANAVSNNTLIQMQNASVPNAFIFNSSGTLEFQTNVFGSYAGPSVSDGGLGSATIIQSGASDTPSPGGIYFYSTATNPAQGYYVWANMGSNSDPGPQDSGNATNGIQIGLTNFNDIFAVTSSVVNAINGQSIAGLTVSYQDNVMTLTSQVEGSTRGNSGFGSGITSSISDVNGFGIRDYFPQNGYIQIFDHIAGTYYTWLNIDASGNDPAPGGTGIVVGVASTDTIATLTSRIISAWSGSTPFSVTASTANSLVIQNPYVGPNTASATSNGSNMTIGNPIAGVQNIDTGTNICTVTAHGYSTGTPVKLQLLSGIMPTGLTAGTLYYIIKVNANSLKFASSLANAMGGIAVAITIASNPGSIKINPQ